MLLCGRIGELCVCDARSFIVGDDASELFRSDISRRRQFCLGVLLIYCFGEKETPHPHEVSELGLLET